jgi:ribosomal protein S18 acetylase RimI-like enzyme
MDLDALAESARNRGLKLVRSRIRTPGKGDHGKVGLVDSAGKPLFGMDGKILTARPEEVQAYLRKLEVADWGASLDEPALRRAKATPYPAANDDLAQPASTPPKARRSPKPKRPPQPDLRRARPADVPGLVPLLRLLGYSLNERAFSKRLRDMTKNGCAPLLAIQSGRIVGLCGMQVSTMLQREKPVGRITVLVVAEDQRGKSIGRMLVEAAEQHFRSAGCELIEVTSNDKHVGAHAFYRRLGFERTSIRFARQL